jgi:hypothetical protein
MKSDRLPPGTFLWLLNMGLGRVSLKNQQSDIGTAVAFSARNILVDRKSDAHAISPDYDALVFTKRNPGMPLCVIRSPVVLGPDNRCRDPSSEERKERRAIYVQNINCVVTLSYLVRVVW